MVKVSITDEDMAPRSNNYFDEGVHEVRIDKVERGRTDGGKDYVEFTVEGQNGESGTARLWFTTEPASNYALSILAGIAVHNKQTDAEKDKARTAFKAIKDTDIIDQKFLDKFVDMDAWYTVQQSDRTYINSKGETKYSYDKNIYGYEPKLKARPVTAEQLASVSEPIDDDEIPF